MDEAQIPGGATIWARKTIDSEIFYDKPAEWFKIWFFLVNRVNHKPYRKWDRGECHVTYTEIEEKTKTTKNQIDHCIRFLKKEKMLATRKATRGMHLNIVKYCIYQDFDNYTRDTESETGAKQKRNRSDTINKNDKKEKNEKKYIRKFISPTSKEVIQYFEDNGYDKNVGVKAFDYYEAGDWKDSRGNKVKNWKQKMRGVWFKDENKIDKKNYSSMSDFSLLEEKIKIQKERKDGKKVDNPELLKELTKRFNY